MPFSLRYSPRRCPRKVDVDARDALEDLVGSDAVECGESVKEGNGDLHAGGHADVLSRATVRKRRRYASGATPRRRWRDAPERLGGAEPAAGGDQVERVVRRLELDPGGLDSHAFDELRRGLADFRGEDAGEVAHAHGRRRGHGGHPVISTRGRLDQGLHRTHGGALGAPHPHRRGELGLPARADGGTSRATEPPSGPRRHPDRPAPVRARGRCRP